MSVSAKIVAQQSPAQMICDRVSEMATVLEQLPMEVHQASVTMLAQLFQARAFAENKRIEATRGLTNDGSAVKGVTA